MTTPEEGDGWRRLHPLTVLKEFGSLMWAVAAAIVLDFDDVPSPIEGVEPDVIVAIGVFAYAIARYLFTAYRVTDRTLEVRRGVFVKALQVMPRDRVQAVGATTGFVGRVLGVTTVEVSAADAEDIRLGFVSEEHASELRRVLERDVPGDEDDEERQGDVLSAIDVRRLVTYGLTESGLVAAVVAMIGAVVAALIWGLFFIPLPAAALFLWPLMRTVGLVGFRSTIEQDRVRMQAGIVGRRHSESPLGRIQVVQVYLPPLRRLVGQETVSIVTGDVGVSSESVQIAGTVAPLEPAGSWRRVATALLGEILLDEADLERSSRLTIRRTIFRGVASLLLPVATAVAVAAIFDLGWWLPVLIAGLGMAAIILYSFARWRVLGWAMDSRHLLIRRGVVSRRLNIVPIHKVQDVTIRTTPFQRRLGIATVEVDTAGIMLTGQIVAVDLPEERARLLADRLAEAAARVALPDGV